MLLNLNQIALHVSDTHFFSITESVAPTEGATPAEGASAEGAPAEGAPGKMCYCYLWRCDNYSVTCSYSKASNIVLWTERIIQMYLYTIFVYDLHIPLLSLVLYQPIYSLQSALFNFTYMTVLKH